MTKRGRILGVLMAMLGIAGMARSQSNYFPKEINKLAMAAYYVSQYYVDSINSDKMVDDAIADILKRLDPHSSYIPLAEVKEMNDPLQGSFEGIGVTYQMMEDTMYVIQTISGAPAEKVGVLPGDRVINVNDTSIVAMKTTDIQKRIRGPKGTVVTVDVVRRGVREPIKFNITRDKIPLYSVDASYMVTPEVGYVKINRFSKTTMDEYVEAIEKLQKQGMKSLILDLQGNGGGYLNVAQNLVSMFINENKMVVYTQGLAAPREELRSMDRFFDGNGQMLPSERRKAGQMRSQTENRLVVLVDESSASASEITSGALQDWDRAVIVGRRTFGKGLVQKPIKLMDGSEIRLTIARYYTPSGRCIQKPYEKNGKEDYGKDLEERFNRGEYMHEDSIHFPDSLKYETMNLKRTIYGGGGIMPDVFVPLDTTYSSKYYRDIIAKGALNKFCLQYVEAHRAELDKKYKINEEGSLARYKKGFEVTNAMFEELKNVAKVAEVEFDEAGFKRAKPHMKMQIKAMIARDLWTNNAYYEIMNDMNPIFMKAKEIITNEDLYRKSFVDRKK